ncbi:MAG: hemin uptake protein HemP [Candidatus Dactylopiibacterium sp.]|nr:hemin uptake protein HemP [Candidatus Dactylopiibacterium sp.]
MSTAMSPALPLPRPLTAGGQNPAAEARISSLSLLGGANTLIIEHMGMHYTLRATRNGKLILTK